MSGFQIIFFILKSFLIPAFAGSFNVVVQEGDVLFIKGIEAQVQLVAKPGGSSLKVSGVEVLPGEGKFILTKKNRRIDIQFFEYDTKNAWINALGQIGKNQKVIEISGPPLPVEIHLLSGAITSQSWTQDLKVSMTQGRFYSSGGSGIVDLYLQKGDATIIDQVGKVQADTYAGNLALKNIQGDIDLDLFNGPLLIEKPQGFCLINSRFGNVKVLQGEGVLSFENGKGNFNSQGFLGRIEGQNQEGTVSINMPLDSEVHIKSKQGRVQIQTPPSSGVSVNLAVAEGELAVPQELRTGKTSPLRTIRGRLKGETQRGSIFVRSQEGSINVN